MKMATRIVIDEKSSMLLKIAIRKQVKKKILLRNLLIQYRNLG